MPKQDEPLIARQWGDLCLWSQARPAAASLATGFQWLSARIRRLTAAARLTDTSGVPFNFLSFTLALTRVLGVSWILATSSQFVASTDRGAD